MMGQTKDELESSDDEDHFPSQGIMEGKQPVRQAMMNELNPAQTKTTKFDKLLKVSEYFQAEYLYC